MAHLQAEGLGVYLGDDGDFGAPEGFSRLPYVYRPDLTEAQAAALNEANYRVTQLSSDLQDIDPEADDAPGAFGPLVSAMAAVGASASCCCASAAMSATITKSTACWPRPGPSRWPASCCRRPSTPRSISPM